MNETSIVTAPITPLQLPSSNRRSETDKRFESETNVEKISLANIYFQRLVGKKIMFRGIDFSFSIFDTCYLRQCVFQDCNFTGCRFLATNLYGSSFVGCRFDYAIFERTIVDSEILEGSAPPYENLKLKFARTLRANFQTIGDANSVNKAIKLELAATKEHLWKGWQSNESYYRKKYDTIWKRARIFISWFIFRFLDFIWGNGESLWKLGRTVIFALLFMSIVDVQVMAKNSASMLSYLDSFLHVPAIFFGVRSPTQYWDWFLAIVAGTRLVTVGLFISILVKRFNRR